MFTTYRDIVADSTPGRFEGESPMTAYLWDCVMNGDYGDEDAGDTDYGWANRYGRRILWGTSTGFISLSTYANEAEAIAVFEDWAEPWHAMDDDEGVDNG
jgi:hypothetical protein